MNEQNIQRQISESLYFMQAAQIYERAVRKEEEYSVMSQNLNKSLSLKGRLMGWLLSPWKSP